MAIPCIKGAGPSSATIMIVGGAVTADDIWKGYPFAGSSGDMLAKMLHEAGLTLSSCYKTNVLKFRAPDDRPDDLITQNKAEASRSHLTSVIFNTYTTSYMEQNLALLYEEVASVQPTVIIALGDLAMWALSGIYGSVDTWRGSHLDYVQRNAIGRSPTIIPTYEVSWVRKMWHVRGFAVRDLQRAKDVADRPELYKWPDYHFTIRPTYLQVTETLQQLITQCDQTPEGLYLAADIETIARHLSCLGIAWNVREALCIPLMTLGGSYWTEAEEVEILTLTRTLLTHPNVRVIGQNFNYDHQHFAKHLGFLPNLAADTMIAQHVIFPGIPKALDFLSSMYCHYHRYWKDEMDDYSRLPENMEQYWTYNCKDVVVTFEVWLVLKELLTHLNKWEQYHFMMEVAESALTTMLRGIAVNQKARSAIAGQLMAAIAEYDELINRVVGEPINVASPKQMADLFYGKLKLPIQIDRKSKRPTCSSKALMKIAEKEPLIQPLVELIEKRRSMGVFLSTFCLMPLDEDGRMRCSFNVCGAETFRFSSSTNAFGNGGNLQNIPKGEEDE